MVVRGVDVTLHTAIIMSATSTRFRVGVWASAVGVAALVAACKSDEVTALEEDNLGTATAAIAPAELVRCWVTPDLSTSDPVFQLHKISCSAVLPASYPIKARHFVVGLYSEDGEQVSETLLSPGGSAVVGGLRGNSKPLFGYVNAEFASSEVSGSELTTQALHQEFVIRQRQDFPETAPFVMKLPFSLWPITLSNPGGGYAKLQADYSVSLGAARVGRGLVESDDRDTLRVTPQFSTTDARRSGYFIAPASGPLSVKVVSRFAPTGNDALLFGPGTYEVVNGVLSQVSDNAGPLSNAASDASAVVDGAADASADAGPRCGADNQARCADTSVNDGCLVGHVLKTTDYKCHACGADGQYACDTPDNDGCDTGFVFKTTDYKCHACGADGQVACAGSVNDGCNPGTVFKTTDYKCHRCGGTGQPACN